MCLLPLSEVLAIALSFRSPAVTLTCLHPDPVLASSLDDAVIQSHSDSIPSASLTVPCTGAGGHRVPSASLTVPCTGAGEHHVFLVVTVVLPPRPRGAVAQ